MKDFFISYNSADQQWAEWIAWQLEEAGYKIEIQAWDSRPGKNFVLWMQEATSQSNRTIAVLSQAYLNAAFAQPEWIAAFRQDPKGEKGKLLPILVEACDLKGLLPAITYIDLVGKKESAAKQELLKGVKQERAKPKEKPGYPDDIKRTIKNKPEFSSLLTKPSAIKGLRPFGFEDAELFLRLQRKNILRECVIALTERDFRLGFLSSKSGCGKTSFLQAGVWPTINNGIESHYCVYVKFTDADPFDSIRLALQDQAELSKQESIHLEFLQLLQKAAELKQKNIILLFDQFEQFFVHFPRQEQRQAFIAALAEWYHQKPVLPVKILFSIRGDFVDDLFELQKVLGFALGTQNTFRLKKFTPAQATQIFQAMAETAGLSFDKSFVAEMTEQELANKEDGLISPTDIQILSWMIQGQQTESKRGFNKIVFQKMGGIEGLLENFLKNAMYSLLSESRKQLALKVMLSLVDLERNVRAGVLTLDQIRQKIEGKIPDDEIQASITWLARNDVRLITPGKHNGELGYELAHEHLIPALRRFAGKELSGIARANQLLERRVNEWLGNDRSNRFLLNFQELWTIRKQKPYLEWKKKKKQKEILLKRSQLRLIRYAMTVFLVPVIFFIIFKLLVEPNIEIKPVAKLLKIEEAYIEPVFASLYPNYGKKDSKFGSVKIKNYHSDSILAYISFIAEDYTLKYTPDTVNFKPGETISYVLHVPFKSNILYTKDKLLSGEVKITYTYKGRQKTINYKLNSNIFEKNVITWDDPAKASAFITPLDPSVRKFSQQVIRMIPTSQRLWINNRISRAIILFEALAAYGIKYFPNPNTSFRKQKKNLYHLDTIQYPNEFLNSCSLIGDSDDLTVLYCSLLESVGIPTALVSIPGHIFMMFDTGVPIDQSYRFMDEDDNNLEFINGTIWLPIETTWLDSSFSKAWREGAERFNYAKSEEDTTLEVVFASYGWSKYEPTPPRVTPAKYELKNYAFKIDRSLALIQKWNKKYLDDNYFSVLEKNPNNFPVQNLLGILYAQNGQLQKAKEIFEAMHWRDPKKFQFSVLNNLANVYFMLEIYDSAIQYYTKAIELNEYAAGVYLNLSFLYFSRKDSFQKGSKNYLEFEKAFNVALEKAGDWLNKDIDRALELLSLPEDTYLEEVAKPKMTMSNKLMALCIEFKNHLYRSYKSKNKTRKPLQAGRNTNELNKDLKLTPIDLELASILWWSK